MIGLPTSGTRGHLPVLREMIPQAIAGGRRAIGDEGVINIDRDETLGFVVIFAGDPPDLRVGGALPEPAGDPVYVPARRPEALIALYAPGPRGTAEAMDNLA